MSKGDDVFWRQFGVIVILLTVFGFAMYFVANSIAGDAYARMYSDQDAVVARIAPVGQSRTGDPAAQTQAPEQTAAVATQTAPVATQTAPVAEQTAAVAEQTAAVAAADTSATTPQPASQGAGSDSAASDTASASTGGAVDLAAGEKVYQGACFACHMTGVAEAPKLDDPAAWEPRLALGMSGLIQSATAGKGAMPPKGGFAHLTEDDLRNAIGFMLDKAGVSAGG